MQDGQNSIQDGQISKQNGHYTIVDVYCSIHWISHFLQGTKKTRPCITGHPVDYEYDMIFIFFF